MSLTGLTRLSLVYHQNGILQFWPNPVIPLKGQHKNIFHLVSLTWNLIQREIISQHRTSSSNAMSAQLTNNWLLSRVYLDLKKVSKYSLPLDIFCTNMCIGHFCKKMIFWAFSWLGHLFLVFGLLRG